MKAQFKAFCYNLNQTKNDIQFQIREVEKELSRIDKNPYTPDFGVVNISGLLDIKETYRDFNYIDLVGYIDRSKQRKYREQDLIDIRSNLSLLSNIHYNFTFDIANKSRNKLLGKTLEKIEELFFFKDRTNLVKNHDRKGSYDSIQNLMKVYYKEEEYGKTSISLFFDKYFQEVKKQYEIIREEQIGNEFELIIQRLDVCKKQYFATNEIVKSRLVFDQITLESIKVEISKFLDEFKTI